MADPALYFRSRRLGPGKVVRDCWLEQSVANGWVAAYRLVPQEGYPCVAEFRLFPRDVTARGENSGPSDNQPGEWAAERQGFTVPVPPGGLTARMLKSVRFGTYLNDATKNYPAYGARVGARCSPW